MWDVFSAAKTLLNDHRNSIIKDYILGILQAAMCLWDSLLQRHDATCHSNIIVWMQRDV